MLDFSFCSNFSTLYPWIEDTIFLQFIPGAVTCVLVVIQFVRQSVQMYRITKQWQVNRYMILLFRQGILYFLVYVTSFPRSLAEQSVLTMTSHGSTLVFGLVNLPTQCLFDTLTKGLPPVLFVAFNVPLFTLTPRFILSIRVMYARNLRRDRQGYGIDTGFGFSSPSHTGANRTTMVFADIERNEVSEMDEVTYIEEGEYSSDLEW